MLRWLISLLMALVLMALITSPTRKEFDTYVYQEIDSTGSCKPVLHYNGRSFLHIFSLNYAWECTAHKTAGSTNRLRPAYYPGIDAYRKHTYLGLFGTFWEL